MAVVLVALESLETAMEFQHDKNELAETAESMIPTYDALFLREQVRY
jgi:hypothetical protein